MNGTGSQIGRLAALVIVGIAASVGASVSAAHAQDMETAAAQVRSGISVSGAGEVKVRPDIARLEFGVQTQDIDPQKASQENARLTDAAMKAARALGIDEKDLRTSGYSINPQYDYGLNGNNHPPRIVGYQVSNIVSVTVRKIEDTGRVIDAAVKAGANFGGGIDFDVNDVDKQKAQDEALAKAVADAERKARVIARAGNLGRIDLVSIAEGGAPPVVRPMFRAMALRAEAAPSATPVAPGEQTISASVSARYSFIPGAKPNYE